MPVLKPPQRFTFINSGKEPLTIETLKKFEGLEHLSDEEASEIIFALRAFAHILASCKTWNEKDMFQ
jgi:hypothetical protein